MMIASDLSGPISSEKRGPPAGRSSAAAAAAVTSGRAGGSFGFSHAHRLRRGIAEKELLAVDGARVVARADGEGVERLVRDVDGDCIVQRSGSSR